MLDLSTARCLVLVPKTVILRGIVRSHVHSPARSPMTKGLPDPMHRAHGAEVTAKVCNPKF